MSVGLRLLIRMLWLKFHVTMGMFQPVKSLVVTINLWLILLSKYNCLQTSGLYYKTITIVIMMIVSDATIRSINYNRN